MKKITLFALALAALASCSKDSSNPASNDPVEVTFSSAIETRASGTSWSANDEIGIFMLDGTDNIDILSSNVAYKTSGDGKFSGSDALIYYPQTGTVDFLAYYPYQSDMVDYSYSINTADQSDLEAIDLMIATKVEDLTETSGTASLSFKHELCEVIFNLQSNGSLTDEELEGLSATLGSVLTTNAYDISDSSFGTAAGADTIDLNVSEDGKTITVILVPQTISAATLTFTLEDGKKFTGSYYETLVSGKSYSYTVPVGQNIFEVGAATITGWGDGTETHGGTINTQMQ
ncbi:MAG: fimbrillin family protein [Rikenellaceae bacterium]